MGSHTHPFDSGSLRLSDGSYQRSVGFMVFSGNGVGREKMESLLGEQGVTVPIHLKRLTLWVGVPEE